MCFGALKQTVQITAKRIDVENFSQHELHPKSNDAHAANWIFIVDTLNFCFWTPREFSKYSNNNSINKLLISI